MRKFTFAAILATLAFALPQTASAALILNATGTGLGFTLSTFASGFPTSGGIGPVGVAQLSNGNIVVANYADDTNYVFSNVDGQTPATALFASFTNEGHSGTGMATLGSDTYTVHYSDSKIYKVNLDGSLGAVVSNVANYNGLAASALTNALYVAGPSGVHKIDLSNPDPNTNASPFGWGGFADGITVSPDGHTVYLETGSQILGFDAISGLQVYTSPALNAPDGVGIITGGVLGGYIISNSNNGVLQLLNPADSSIVDIATGGGRGDIVGFDTSNGTLLLTMGDSVYRLGLKGAVIGGGSSSGGGTVPEPATLSLLGIGLVGLGFAHRRRSVVQK